MPKAGEMAYGCASCAQPGVNLPMNWKEDPHPEVFTRFLCVDGNFSADHLKQRNAMDDVWLTSGEGMMTEKEAYKKYLAQPTVTRQVKSTCSNHQAINNASQNHAGCDATGIAAFACPRSGAFIPGSVVDFQKGKRQLNIDYALCEALKNMGLNGLDDIMIIYDMMCQYHVNLWDRIANNPNLSISEKANLIMGIGLFHVHGHQDECLFRLATSFIPGAGMMDDDLAESNFSGSAPDIMVVAATKVAQAQAAALAAAEAVEHVKLALLSAMGEEHLQAHGLQHFLSKKYQLRQGQANDALQGVRVSLANLSFEYGRKLQKIKKSKVKKTRAWATVHAVGRTLHHHRQIYSYAIDAISRLGDPEKKIGRQYKPLLKEDMKANTAVADPNARGQSRAKPAWFWSSNLAGDMQDNERMVDSSHQLASGQGQVSQMERRIQPVVT
ncbi:uncharacterized protein LACBIDRAFT_336148 [Laccaria bicolor S238N-H82]|uniref:Predicted protein n=1 Tax=Laccaria bicolor (strain S238N-H82 / ATCC MYA-4686) TaxID=486041 RepID=B0E4J5_LACBS|nr:uncharacterized protein LACBIDRAFT_336148 [Laccaria bicolor S238N-H82]EDQ98237.1 predicted protein [Laccaria bicolor S238N-H82]|eukprot:XP_001891113.1 predicted protein [Laccaria bicolor S238N-H82]